MQLNDRDTIKLVEHGFLDYRVILNGKLIKTKTLYSDWDAQCFIDGYIAGCIKFGNPAPIQIGKVVTS